MLSDGIKMACSTIAMAQCTNSGGTFCTSPSECQTETEMAERSGGFSTELHHLHEVEGIRKGS